MMRYIRHTMGNDWGGRRKQNPEGCPKVTWKDVFAYVASWGIHVKWGGPTAVKMAPGGTGLRMIASRRPGLQITFAWSS
jgi:hypothetical protein